MIRGGPPSRIPLLVKGVFASQDMSGFKSGEGLSLNYACRKEQMVPPPERRTYASTWTRQAAGEGLNLQMWRAEAWRGGLPSRSLPAIVMVKRGTCWCTDPMNGDPEDQGSEEESGSEMSSQTDESQLGGRRWQHI